MSSQAEVMHCDVQTTEPRELTYSWFFNEEAGEIAVDVANQMGVNVSSVSGPGETTVMHDEYFHVKNIRRERPAPPVSSEAVGPGQTVRQRDVAVDNAVSKCAFVVQGGEVCIGFNGFPDKEAEKAFEEAVSIACTEHGEHNWRPLRYRLLDVRNFLFGDLVEGVREVGQTLSGL